MMVKYDFKALRKLNDTDCTNIVTARNIYRLIKKHPSFKDLEIDCWVHGGHYTRFSLEENKFNWYTKDGANHIVDDSDFINNEELNKLIVNTYLVMCDNINNELDFIDSAEELLAISEAKLKEIISEESNS